MDKQTAHFFQEEIERVKSEYATGQTFYPTILKAANELGDYNK